MSQEEATVPAEETVSEQPTPSAPPAPQGEPGPQPQKVAKPKPTQILPTDRFIFNKQLNVLRAYGVASSFGSKPTRINDVANIVKMTASTVSMANPFFIDIGLLLKSGMGYVPAPEVIAFARAYEWNPEAAAHKLAPLLEQTWFAQELLPRLTFGQMDESGAVADLAHTAGAGPEYRNQIRILIDYLEAGGLVQRDGDFLRKPAASHRASATNQERTTPQPAAEQRDAQPSRTSVSTVFTQAAEGVVQFHISVKVDMSEFAGWQPDRIAAFFGGIAQVLAAKGAVEKGAAEE
jgi:hypothetical protein